MASHIFTSWNLAASWLRRLDAQKRCITLLGYNSDMASPTSSAADAFRTTLDLFDMGLDLMRQNLRRSHPGSGDAEIERLLGDWLLDRPGAESGDCTGRPVDVGVRLV